MSHQIGRSAISRFGSAWTWWTKPRCVSWGGCVYVGSVDRLGRPLIEEWTNVAYPRRRHVLSSLSNESDDHNNPALVLEPGYAPIAVYARHGWDNLLRYRIGDATFVPGESLGTFGAEQSITCAGVVTYAQAFVYGGVVHVLTRSGGWSYVKSTDWGATWSSPVVLFDGSSQFYVAAQQVGSTLRMAVSSHPLTGSEPDQNIYYAELNLFTGVITSSGGTVGNTDGTSLPIDYGTLEVSATPTSTYKTWVYDVAGLGDPAVVWCSFDNADWPGTSMYHYSVKVGGVWSTYNVVAAGESFNPESPVQPYFGGAQFESATTLLTNREAAGVWYLDRQTTADGGASWTPTNLASESNADRAIVRSWPVQDRDDLAPFAVVSNHTQSFDAYTNFRGNVGGSRI